jgi:hypothetical protein
MYAEMARDIILEFPRKARQEPGLQKAMQARTEHDRQDHERTMRPLDPQ